MTMFVCIRPVPPFLGCDDEDGFFVYATLPFGWKVSAFLHQTIGLAAINYVRSFGVPCALYIDDRHVGQLRLPLRPLSSSFSACQLAEMAGYIACFTSISLEYFIALTKSSLLPATALTFLGYVCDSVRQAFPALSVTLLCYERNRSVLGLPRSRLRPSSLTSFFNFAHFSEATSLLTTSLLRSVTSMLGIWPSFVCSLSRVIGSRILDACSPKRF